MRHALGFNALLNLLLEQTIELECEIEPTPAKNKEVGIADDAAKVCKLTIGLNSSIVIIIGELKVIFNWLPNSGH